MEQKSIRCQEDVALSITKHLFSKQDYQRKNLIFSPISLHVALSIMASGSAGRTLDELLSFLQFDSIDHLNTFFSQLISAVFSNTVAPSHHLSFVNGMWADESLSLSKSFKQHVVRHYKATLKSVDFKTKGDQVCHEVNSWVEKETNGLITKLLPPKTLSESIALIFANALCFKGAWKRKFTKTFDSNFHLPNGTSVKVPYMTTKNKEQFISIFDGFKILRLSYKQGRDKTRRFSMYIFLPDTKDGLPALIEKLASETGFLEGKLPRRKVRARKFMIPKFKISFAFEACPVLKELGVVSPFSRHADFTKMVEVNSPSNKLYVGSIFHKTFVEVNERGTEAGAGTLVRVFKSLNPEDFTGIDFAADHPFLFMIQEDFTGTILFIGQVLHPLDGAVTSVKEELRTKDFAFPFGKAVKLNFCDSEPEESGEEDEGDDEDDMPEVPPKRKKSSKDD
ncbi:serpin-ZX-like [Lotus japonicus]|uniref:serpin-ZX-like n=1 Tax=Lotus japonicus TaxID=34305 RepID=UPI00258F28D2|nr:serpin-ZX-like [Lotus japonicus]